MGSRYRKRQSQSTQKTERDGQTGKGLSERDSLREQEVVDPPWREEEREFRASGTCATTPANHVGQSLSRKRFHLVRHRLWLQVVTSFGVR